MKKLITFRLSTFALLALLAWIFLLGGQAVQAVQPQAPGKIADEQLFSYIGKDPLPSGTIPWQLLRQVKLVEGKAKNVKGEAAPKSPALLPEFSAQLKELDNQEVKIYGFVLPLSVGTKQKHFLISPLPSHCPYCVSQGPDSMVEVIAKTPVEFNQWDPIVVTGKLELVNDQYLFFRLTNAESIKF